MEKVSGFVLAGGKSKRFGENKALVTINGTPIIQRIVNELKKKIDDVYIITNEPELYGFLEVPCYTDIFPGLGPLGGIHTALNRTFSQYNLIISCDLPLFSHKVISLLMDSAEKNEEAVLFSIAGKREPFPLLLQKSVLPKITHSLQRRNLVFQALLDACSLHIIPIEEHLSIAEPYIFRNCNTPEDLENLMKYYKQQ